MKEHAAGWEGMRMGNWAEKQIGGASSCPGDKPVKIPWSWPWSLGDSVRTVAGPEVCRRHHSRWATCLGFHSLLASAHWHPAQSTSRREPICFLPPCHGTGLKRFPRGFSSDLGWATSLRRRCPRWAFISLMCRMRGVGHGTDRIPFSFSLACSWNTEISCASPKGQAGCRAGSGGP